MTKVLRDRAFRAALRRNPGKALEKAGVEPTPAMIRALKRFDWRSAERVAKAFRLKFRRT
ncbi:MAG TPA: Os1348 family NHLP clan protein [Gemmatimonadales bacterium]|nr:Os1348 family NHLP clan protein [Gemmatimonadales bacterium]